MKMRLLNLWGAMWMVCAPALCYFLGRETGWSTAFKAMLEAAPFLIPVVLVLWSGFNSILGKLGLQKQAKVLLLFPLFGIIVFFLKKAKSD